jgi:hypothetical protein
MWQTSWDFNETLKSFEIMAAYGVIGGIIGGAIALAITPLLRKKLKKNNKKKDKKSQAPRSYRPGAAWFGFIMAIGMIVSGLYFLWYSLYNMMGYIYVSVTLFETCFGTLYGCWTGSYLGGRITISKDRLIVDHAAKMPKENNRHIHFWQLGRHHIDVSWYEIRELRADINHMKIILHNDEVYSFPIGWCKDKARDELARYKRIKPWE